jgi:hypothetical protein
VPPALRGDTRTYRGSQQSHSCHPEAWRDLPPHKEPPQSPPRCSDSPNWRTPSPNRPASFWSPSPPQSPPAPPISPLCSEIPPMPSKHHTESRVVSELVSIIKTTSDALQSIIWIAERLIRQVNAERRLAHKPRRSSWSLREDAHGNTVRPQPPAFPSGRGVPVTGSLGGSEVLA